MNLAPVHEGEVIDGKYRVDAFLGKGAMGFVVRATQLALDRTVAIKFLLGAAHEDAQQRFMREARIAAKLKSQYAAKVFEVGVYQSNPYIVMEYLEGEDLAALLQRVGPLDVGRAVGYVLQACEALAEAHAVGVVHRDVKPANMMLTTGAGGVPCVKLLDFGVSKASGVFGPAGTHEAALTATSHALGSPLYMAPEQINDSAHVDGRADIWSLGVVLYQLLADATPWSADSILTLFGKMATYPPTPLGEYRPDVPPALADAVLRCLEKSRDRRWSSVAEFAAAIAPYAAPSTSRASFTSFVGSAPATAGSARVGAPAAQTQLTPSPFETPAAPAPVGAATTSGITSQNTAATAATAATSAKRGLGGAAWATLALASIVAIAGAAGAWRYLGRAEVAPAVPANELPDAAASAVAPPVASSAAPPSIAPAPVSAEAPTTTSARPAVPPAAPSAIAGRGSTLKPWTRPLPPPPIDPVRPAAPTPDAYAGGRK